jgi:hypothetical protein
MAAAAMPTARALKGQRNVRVAGLSSALSGCAGAGLPREVAGLVLRLMGCDAVDLFRLLDRETARTVPLTHRTHRTGRTVALCQRASARVFPSRRTRPPGHPATRLADAQYVVML